MRVRNDSACGIYATFEDQSWNVQAGLKVENELSLP